MVVLNEAKTTDHEKNPIALSVDDVMRYVELKNRIKLGCIERQPWVATCAGDDVVVDYLSNVADYLL